MKESCKDVVSERRGEWEGMMENQKVMCAKEAVPIMQKLVAVSARLAPASR